MGLTHKGTKQRNISKYLLHYSNLKVKTGEVPTYGGNRHDLTGWLDLLKTKLQSHRDFNTARVKVLYAYNRLRNRALDWAQTQGGSDAFSNYKHFVREIIRAFGDLDPIQMAEHKLRNLKQGPHNCNWYYTEFNRYANKLELGDASKISQWKLGLNNEIYKELTGIIPLPTIFVEFLHIYITVENKLNQYKDKLRGENRSAEGSKGRSERPNSSWNPIRSEGS